MNPGIRSDRVSVVKSASVSPVWFPIMLPRMCVVAVAWLLLPIVGVLAMLPAESLIRTAFAYFLLLLSYIVFSGARMFQSIQNASFSLYLPDEMYSGLTTTVGVGLRNADVSQSSVLRLAIELEVMESELEWRKELDEVDSPLFFTTITPRARGVAEISKVAIRVTDSYSLFAIQFICELASPVRCVVAPNPGIADSESLMAALRANSGDLALQRQRGTGREFDSLRHYVAGDDLRKVDWKRSAKGRGLLVKSYRPESHQRIFIMVDCGRRLSTIVDGRQKLEFATDATAHLLKAVAEPDDEFGFFAFNSEVIKSISFRKGRAQHRLILDSLQDLQAGSLESDYQILTRQVLQEHRRCLLLVISSVSNPAGIESLARSLLPVRNRHLAVLLALADNDLDAVAQGKADSVIDAYSISAACEQKRRITSALQSMERQGIKSVYTDARHLSHELRNAYLEAKRSGKL